MKIVINDCTGGFSLSKEVYDELGIPWDNYGFCFDTFIEKGFKIDRSDPRLIAAIEKIGCDKASGERAKLKILEIPDDIEYYIEDTGWGEEIIHEKHRTWY